MQAARYLFCNKFEPLMITNTNKLVLLKYDSRLAITHVDIIVIEKPKLRTPVYNCSIEGRMENVFFDDYNLKLQTFNMSRKI